MHRVSDSGVYGLQKEYSFECICRICVLSMVEQDFSYESVFRFLRTGFTEFTRDEIDRLENYVVAVGLRGYKKWQAVWARKTNRTDEEELAVLNGLRVRFVEMTESLVFVLKQ